MCGGAVSSHFLCCRIHWPRPTTCAQRVLDVGVSTSPCLQLVAKENSRELLVSSFSKGDEFSGYTPLSSRKLVGWLLLLYFVPPCARFRLMLANRVGLCDRESRSYFVVSGDDGNDDDDIKGCFCAVGVWNFLCEMFFFRYADNLWRIMETKTQPRLVCFLEKV